MEFNNIVFKIVQDTLKEKYSVTNITRYTELWLTIDKVDFVDLVLALKERLAIRELAGNIDELAELLFNHITVEDLVILLVRSMKQKETV